MSEKIDKTTELKLLGLQTLAERHMRMLKELEEAVCEITGEPLATSGYSADFVWGEQTTIEFLWERTASYRQPPQVPHD